MKISVVVPVYNTSKYLRKCLDSLVNQTFKDIEIICVNDGSTDSSLSILQEYKAKYNSIKIISQKNQGLSSARNTGIEAACGDYIGFVDSDDWVDLDFFAKLYEAILYNDCDIAVASIIREKNFYKKYRVKYFTDKIYYDLEERVKICGLPKSSYVWNKLYKKDVIKLFKPNVFFEDMFWIPKILQQTKSLVTVSGINYHYRATANSIVKSIPTIKKQNDYYLAQQQMIEFFETNQIKIEEKVKNITKKKVYFWKILLLKIKEYKYTQTFYILGFFPILKITNYMEIYHA